MELYFGYVYKSYNDNHSLVEGVPQYDKILYLGETGENNCTVLHHIAGGEIALLAEVFPLNVIHQRENHHK